MTADPIIIALDFESSREADRLVSALGDSAGFYKAGMELYPVAGMDYVRRLIDRDDVREPGYDCTVGELVSGMDDIAGSPVAARTIRALAGETAILVTPGVRSRGAAAGDQKRVATPAEAVHDGASYVAVGWEVTRSADPEAALVAIHDELQVHVWSAQPERAL